MNHKTPHFLRGASRIRTIFLPKNHQQRSLRRTKIFLKFAFSFSFILLLFAFRKPRAEPKIKLDPQPKLPRPDPATYVSSNVTSSQIQYSSLPEYAVMVSSCSDPQSIPDEELNATFHVWRRLSCNKITNSINSHESVPMIQFLIDTYDKPLAKKYIFIHNNKYKIDFLSRLKIVLDNFKSNWNKVDGAMYPSYWRNNLTSFAVFGKNSIDDNFPGIYKGIEFEAREMTLKRLVVAPCCSTFFIDAKHIRDYPVEDYQTLRDNLREWSVYHNDCLRSSNFPCGKMIFNWVPFSSGKSIPDIPGA